jgi:hypothetical protein
VIYRTRGEIQQLEDARRVSCAAGVGCFAPYVSSYVQCGRAWFRESRRNRRTRIRVLRIQALGCRAYDPSLAPPAH